MRNLKLLMHNNFKSEKLNDARIFCAHNIGDDDVVYFATKDLLLFKLHSAFNELELCVNLNDYKGFLESCTAVIALTYLIAEDSLCISASNGTSVLYDSLSGTIYDFYSTEESDNGMKCICWSPDQEVFVIITGNDILRIISQRLEVVCEPISLHDDFVVKSLELGWGSKETQFLSSVERQDQNSGHENKLKMTMANDDCKTRVSWKCDGQMFAVSFVNPTTATRIIRIWSREGTFLSSSEALNGLEQSLSWQPSGSLIASTLRNPTRHKVVFFERNCLPHGEFALPYDEKEAKVHEVLWNVDGTLLAVWSENSIMEEQNEKDDQHLTCNLRIWAVSNYHWYCKHSLSSTYLKFPLIAAMQWDYKTANKLHILCQDGLYLCCYWSWSLDHQISNSKYDLGIVSVIDGGKILVTSFRHMIIPPPLCSFEYSLQKNVNAIIFPAFTNSNDMLSVMEDSSVAFFTCDHKEIVGNDQTTIQLESLHLKAIYKLNWKTSNDVPSLLSLRHWVWISQSVLVFVYTLHNTSVMAFTTVDLTSHDTEFVINKCLPLPGEPIVVIPFTDEKTVVVHMLDGSILAVNCDGFTVRNWTDNDSSALTLPNVCCKISAVTREGQSRLLSLSENCNLYVDAFELANNCTSYFLVEEFLLFTTHAHELHCIPIRSLFKITGSIRTGDGCIMPREVRKIERGAKIVVAVMSECKVILQMPRGNLETIYPRPLVLYLVCHHLNNLQYKDALLLIRKHRIDMNLIFDHDPELFLKNVNKFVEQLTDVTWINLFLSGLQEEDVTVTLYKNVCRSLEFNYVEGRRPRRNKIDAVCDVTLNAMEVMDSNKYFLGILTAHVKKSKSELDVALRKIQLLRENQGTHGVCCDTAIAHLLYLVDIDELYNVALGTYDFDLVLMVAEKSQKDPKEYLPFLNDLKVLEENYRRFKIDKFLKRYEKALHNILQCDIDRHSECLAFIREHDLYSEALEELSCTSKLYKAVLYEYGSYLAAHDKFHEAGIMYLKGEFYTEAMEAFKRSGNWKQGLMIAYKMNYSRQDIIILAKHFSDFLSDRNEIIDAAHVEEVYADDPQSSILILINGREWDRALLMMHKYSMLKFLDSHLLPKLTEHYVTLSKTLQSLKTDFETHKDRLNILKQEKTLGTQGNDATHSYSDNVSEMSSYSDISSSSRSRSASALSSRATQKQKKKIRQVSLRKGSRYEDVALYEALTKIIIQIDNHKEECGNLIKALMLHGFGSDAKNLQLQMDSLTTYVKSCVPDIWTVEKVIDVQDPVQARLENVRLNRDVPQEYQQFLNPPYVSNSSDWKLTCL